MDKINYYVYLIEKQNLSIRKLRDKIKSNEYERLSEDVKNKLQHYIKSAQYQKYLQDAIITVRDDRYVIPVKMEYKGNIHGLVHDVSSSGATVFVEPIEIVNLNNQIKILIKEESAEIDRILREFTARVAEICNQTGKSTKTVLKDLTRAMKTSKVWKK